MVASINSTDSPEVPGLCIHLEIPWTDSKAELPPDCSRKQIRICTSAEIPVSGTQRWLSPLSNQIRPAASSILQIPKIRITSRDRGIGESQGRDCLRDPPGPPRLAGRPGPERESSLLTTYWSGSTDVFGGPASRHGSLNSLFQVALYLPS